jgi:hypothetical protein
MAAVAMGTGGTWTTREDEATVEEAVEEVEEEEEEEEEGEVER